MKYLVALAVLSCLPSLAAGSEVWVDCASGSDTNDGTRLHPFASIQEGVSAADGIQVHTVYVEPGDYREQVAVTKSHVHIVANPEHRGEVVLYASEPSQGMRWREVDPPALPAAARGHVWEADVSGWGPVDPKLAFLVRNDGTTEDLALAREPDWEVTTPWKYHEHWWTVDLEAEQGLSSSQLASLADLTGGRAWIKDGYSGHDTFGPVITGQSGPNVSLSFADGNDLVRRKRHTKFYVEGKVQLLDTEGEWCFDATAQKIYIWPPGDASPAELHIEFAKRLNAITLVGSDQGGDLEDVVVDGLVIRGGNHHNDFYQGPSAAVVMIVDASRKHLSDITIRDCLIEHNARGIYLWDRGDDGTTTIGNMTIEDSEIGYSEGNAISANSNRRQTAAILGMVVQRCHIHHAGFRNYPKERDAPAINVQYTDGFRFLDNEVDHTGHNGIQVDRMYSNCLLEGNYFWDCGLNGSDEGSIKFHAYSSRRWKGPVSTVVTGNIIRGNMGWSYASAVSSRWEGTGLAGAGIYFDISSGALLYRNLILDTGFAGLWSANRGTDYVWMYNNTVLSCRQGVQILRANAHSRVVNNLVMDPNYAELGLAPDYGDGAAFCGEVWENVAPGESDHNAYRLDGGGEPMCALWYWDEANRKKWELEDASEIAQFGRGLGGGSLSLKGGDDSIVADAAGYDVSPVTGSPIIDVGAPLPEDVAEVLRRVGLETDAPVGKGYDIGANEYNGAPRHVRLVTPTAGGQCQIGGRLVISWDAPDFVGLVKIDLSRDGGATWEEISAGVPASWESFHWKIAGESSAQSLIRLSDYGGRQYDLSEPFAISVP